MFLPAFEPKKQFQPPVVLFEPARDPIYVLYILDDTVNLLPTAGPIYMDVVSVLSQTSKPPRIRLYPTVGHLRLV